MISGHQIGRPFCNRFPHQGKDDGLLSRSRANAERKLPTRLRGGQRSLPVKRRGLSNAITVFTQIVEEEAPF
jgi:hypothetical protein